MKDMLVQMLQQIFIGGIPGAQCVAAITWQAFELDSGKGTGEVVGIIHVLFLFL